MVYFVASNARTQICEGMEAHWWKRKWWGSKDMRIGEKGEPKEGWVFF
jgi:hypothetical protein